MGTLWPKNWKKLVFACDCAFSSHRIKCNTCTESFLWRASFLLPTLMSYEQYMRTLWPRSMKIWWFNRALCSLIHLSALRNLSLKPWANQHMLILKVIEGRWRSNRNLLTVACNCSRLVKRFRFYRNLLLFFEFRYYPYYYYYYFFSGHAIGIANLRNRIIFSHQTPLIHGPLSDTLQRAFRCWSGLPFWI